MWQLMRSTIDIDDNLMREAMRLIGLRTKKAVAEAALRLLIQTQSGVSPSPKSKASPPHMNGVKLATEPDCDIIVRKGRERV
jgi:hypothetical protein